MSTEWYLINSPHYTGGTEKNDFRFNADLGIDDFLIDSPLSNKILLCKGKFDKETNSFEEEFETEGIIQGNSPETQTKGWQRQLLTRLKTISDYKYVKVYDEDYDRWNIWLIMTMPTNNKVYEKVVLYLCNYIAKWQDDDGNIIYQPFHVENASQYNTGEEGNKILTLGYNQLLVYTSLDNETIYTCYFSENKRLMGILTAKSLMSSDDDENITNLMNTNIISVHTHTDQEQVAHLFRKYDLIAMPVLDSDGCLVGIVTFDDAMDVMVDETNEDISRMAAMEPNEKTYFETTHWQQAKHRILW